MRLKRVVSDYFTASVAGGFSQTEKPTASFTPIRVFRHAKGVSKRVQLEVEFGNLSTCI